MTNNHTGPKSYAICQIYLPSFLFFNPLPVNPSFKNPENKAFKPAFSFALPVFHLFKELVHHLIHYFYNVCKCLQF